MYFGHFAQTNRNSSELYVKYSTPKLMIVRVNDDIGQVGNRFMSDNVHYVLVIVKLFIAEPDILYNVHDNAVNWHYSYKYGGSMNRLMYHDIFV